MEPESSSQYPQVPATRPYSIIIIVIIIITTTICITWGEVCLLNVTIVAFISILFRRCL